MVHALTYKILAGFSALAISSTAAYAAPAPSSDSYAAPPAKTAPVKMSDQKLDNVVGGRSFHFQTTNVCSFGISCNGNGGNNNGNSSGFINIGNGILAGASIFSGNTLYIIINL